MANRTEKNICGSKISQRNSFQPCIIKHVRVNWKHAEGCGSFMMSLARPF